MKRPVCLMTHRSLYSYFFRRHRKNNPTNPTIISAPAANTKILDSVICPKLPVVKIAVGPSAPPIIPIEVASMVSHILSLSIIASVFFFSIIMPGILYHPRPFLYSCANNPVEKYLSPVSGNIITDIFPVIFFSCRFLRRRP